MKSFVLWLINQNLTQNEISVLLEAAYADFTREDLLRNTNRVKLGIYSPAALTRTVQKLLKKNLLKEERVGPIVRYKLNKSIDEEICDEFCLRLARSRVLTVNTLRAALFLYADKGNWYSTRAIANGIELTPEYTANSVLPRMYVIGLLNKKGCETSDILTEEDKCEDAEGNVTVDPLLRTFQLDIEWPGYVDEKWM